MYSSVVNKTIFKKMKKLLHTSLYIVAMTLLFSGCADDNTSCTKDISSKIKSMETEYGCENTLVNLHLNQFTDYKIIETAEVYDNFVTGTCHPEIDFDNYYLIVGNTASQSKINSIKYKLYKSCEPNFYTLDVRATIDDSQPGDINQVFHILMPKDETISYFKVLHTFLN